MIPRPRRGFRLFVRSDDRGLLAMQATLPLQERVVRILNLIRPAVQSDGGDVELIDISDDGVVKIRLHGACVGCPSSSVTLKLGIERNLKEHIPEITSVVAVD